MCPDRGRKVFDKQFEEKATHDKVSKEREFSLGEQVLVQNFRGDPRWLEGTVTGQTGPVSFKVLVEDQLWKRHVDHVHQLKSANDVSVTVPDVVHQDYVEVEPHPRTETTIQRSN